MAPDIRVRSLLTWQDASPKLRHGATGYESVVCYLAPAVRSGVMNTCSHASVQCASACLYEQGRAEAPGIVRDTIHAARIARTAMLATDPVRFMQAMVRELSLHAERAAKRGHVPTARLNGMSDVPWLALRCERNGTVYPSLYHAFPEIAFYEYTKRPHAVQAANGSGLSNLHVTFSLSESNDAHAMAVLRAGGSVTAVIRGGHAALPRYARATGDAIREWSGYPVVDGDRHDLRMLDAAHLRLHGVDPERGFIVALRPKGRAVSRTDAGGFFRDPFGALDPERVATFAAATAPRMPRAISTVVAALMAAYPAPGEYGGPSPEGAHRLLSAS